MIFNELEYKLFFSLGILLPIAGGKGNAGFCIFPVGAEKNCRGENPHEKAHQVLQINTSSVGRQMFTALSSYGGWGGKKKGVRACRIKAAKKIRKFFLYLKLKTEK